MPKKTETARQKIVIRRPVDDDIHETLALLLRCKVPEYGLDALWQEWAEMDLTQDAWLAFTGDGSLVGYATVTPYHNTGLAYHVYVDPGWEGTALNRMLLLECDRQGSTLLAAQTESSEATVVTWIANGNERDQQAVEEAGFRLMKRTFVMCIEMQHSPPEPQWPEGITVRSVIPEQDARAICHLMASVFEGTHLEPTTFEGWRDGMIGGAYFDADLWFVALHKEEIIGACLCAVYPEAQEAWVRQLGVAKQWQRRGVGTGLMLHAFRRFYRRGHEAVRIGVEADTPAHRLYEQLGMRRLQQYDEYQKRIG